MESEWYSSRNELRGKLSRTVERRHCSEGEPLARSTLSGVPLLNRRIPAGVLLLKWPPLWILPNEAWFSHGPNDVSGTPPPSVLSVLAVLVSKARDKRVFPDKEADKRIKSTRYPLKIRYGRAASLAERERGEG